MAPKNPGSMQGESSNSGANKSTAAQRVVTPPLSPVPKPIQFASFLDNCDDLIPDPVERRQRLLEDGPTSSSTPFRMLQVERAEDVLRINPFGARSFSNFADIEAVMNEWCMLFCELVWLGKVHRVASISPVAHFDASRFGGGTNWTFEDVHEHIFMRVGALNEGCIRLERAPGEGYMQKHKSVDVHNGWLRVCAQLLKLQEGQRNMMLGDAEGLDTEEAIELHAEWEEVAQELMRVWLLY